MPGSHAAKPYAGGEALARSLYSEHAAPLLAYVLRLTNGDRHGAEDVVQETLVRAWQHPEALAGDDRSPAAWLRTVARHLVVDAVRRRRARPHEVGDDALPAVAVDDGVDAALTAWEVTAALGTLSRDHRQVLYETYVHGRSVADAAQVLGVPAGTVKSRTYYALRALRLALEERGVTP